MENTKVAVLDQENAARVVADWRTRTGLHWTGHIFKSANNDPAIEHLGQR